MKLKTYETPEVDLLLINTEVNFCASGDVPDYDFVDNEGISWTV